MENETPFLTDGVFHMETSPTIPEDFRCGYATIIGEPNVGKSTLMNGLLQQKISIVTNKPQTTRHKILGILSGEGHQVVFLDTPGIIKPRYLLQEAMMQFATSAMADADVLLFMIDATSPKMDKDLAHEEAFSRLQGMQKPVLLVINKSDAVKKGGILPIIDFYSKAFPFKEILPISALKLDGTAELLKEIIRLLPQHPPFYPLDIVSEASERFFVAEIIREKIFMKYKEEIPYSATVDIVEFKEREVGLRARLPFGTLRGGQAGGSRLVGSPQAGKTFISADIYVERDSQKGILIGKHGGALKEIGRMARTDIEKFLQRPVFLEMHVKVRPDWRRDDTWLARLGYRQS
ncbi:MAG: GTPase Era [Bacteroidetes bacterium]|nr:GTPase Era [Bacteroidota bacterium]